MKDQEFNQDQFIKSILEEGGFTIVKSSKRGGRRRTKASTDCSSISQEIDQETASPEAIDKLFE